ncbi:MAG: L-aspartate oxidase [Rhodothermales bacterium]|nr:L-aspartate oxidase [Rhodothermales bacterium]MBO6781621.1 L-aspartate oxidase [Rhodothermales bacterium]
MTDRFDYLVIGSGAAGLSFALAVAEYGSVGVVTKKASADSNTNWAQGGIAAVVDDADSVEAHVRDTLTAGAGLCDEEVVRMVVRDGPRRIAELEAQGADFTRSGGRLHLGMEGGHSAHRIVHAADATGAEVEKTLLDQVRDHPNIEVFEYHFAVDLITEHHTGQHVTRVRPDINCYGAYVLDEEENRVHRILARVTMLATGGAGRVYLHTTNPAIATGDGIAMAYRAKARIANMEFVQFHPTSLYPQEADSFLVSEAVRGHGALLRNMEGHRFMPEYDTRAELAPRDIVARAIDDQLKQRGEPHVYLDITHESRDELVEHFPTIYAKCESLGLDMASDLIPVVPAAHYVCGGVVTDMQARTSVQGLLACGEVTYTGLHGANRLASNSLLEALVLSHKAVATARELAGERSFREDVPEWDDSGTSYPAEWVLVSHNREELRRVMWDYVGIVRSMHRLDRASRRTRVLFEETEEFYRKSRVSAPICELRNMIAVSYLIIRSASMRRESRGLHYMTDFPDPREAERRPTFI